MDADGLRTTFTGFFAGRAHEVVPSSSLVPAHPRAPLFTNAGMNQFIPYFLGEETPPFRRATSVQKCVRIRGKHDDIELVGRTTRHLTFFEMLGNFSFGDYFKADAIPWAWELLTDELGLDGDRLWASVYTEDDEAAGIWRDVVGMPADRIQRMGEDNFWEMGETGPCGPSSEIYYDRGPELGPEGGPLGGGEERYVELWNLVFTQYDRQADGTLEPLPRPNIDTGAGLERVLTVLEDVPSIWETGVLRPIIARAESLSGRTYGEDPEVDVSLRVLADHARSTAMLIADGVLPSNDGRGYVLRRLVRRSVLTARRLGVQARVTPSLAGAVAEVMGSAYPALESDLDLVTQVLDREEAGFDRTLRTGLTLLNEALDETREEGARGELAGEVAFRLHDTHGFPIELTEELAAERGVTVDRAGYDEQMVAQRERARQAARTPAVADEDAYRKLLDAEGPTAFVGRSPESYAVPTRVVGVLAGSEPGTAEVFLDRTPFYTEGGGQVGDTGSIVTETGRADVYDTVPALPGLTAHRVRLTGEIFAGQDALAAIDGPRREATRRNHTGTHLLHAALRQVLGDHVRQQGSLVAPDRLRFDYSHHQAPAPEELRDVVAMVNADVLGDDAVETMETGRKEAEAMGAMAFFKDKYGDTVRVVRAGPHSLELCGGTHVDALGMIGAVSVVSEASIGSNTRRIEAVTGLATIERTLEREAVMHEAASLLKVEPEGLVDALQRLLDRQRAADKELSRLRGEATEAGAAELAGEAQDGLVVARRDGLATDELRTLAQAVHRRDGVKAVVLGGSPDGTKVAIVAVTGGDPDAGT
ncbi:MAG TPA: alanine--tRNA ligase, partial [Acidimicrobiales bacterium]|nr:alanine--tRNA ligase [Acidimicrobiales bacterium]